MRACTTGGVEGQGAKYAVAIFGRSRPGRHGSARHQRMGAFRGGLPNFTGDEAINNDLCASGREAKRRLQNTAYGAKM
jgi:hypothetical protein